MTIEPMGGVMTTRLSRCDNLIRAEKFHKRIHDLGFNDTGVFFGWDGEVLITVYCGEHYFEFFVNRNGSVTFVRELNDVEVDSQDNLKEDAALSMLPLSAAEHAESERLIDEIFEKYAEAWKELADK